MEPCPPSPQRVASSRCDAERIGPYRVAKTPVGTSSLRRAVRTAGIDPWVDTWDPLVSALALDGHSSAAETADGRPPLSTVRRQLSRLLRSDTLRFRCAVAQGLTPYPLCVNWWCPVPTNNLPKAVDRLRAHPRARLVASIPGPANLLFSTWGRGPQEALRMQEFVEDELAPARVVDSVVVLRTVKRIGWQLGRQGRATGIVVPFSLRSVAGQLGGDHGAVP